MPGTASGIAPSTSGVIGGGTTRSTSTLLVPGSGPIVLVTPDEQIALIGSEVILFANYKGDDDYLRIGERIEWSLGGVGHIQTTNKTQCSNILALDFNRDKKLSDRFAVTSTLHYEGTIDRGSADEQGKVPHLAGQSWISIQSAEEGTSTVTAFAPTIKDWNRRTSSATVHWIDAEWIYPRPDMTKYDEPKIFVTEVKKRSSGSPCPGWVVRYEVMPGGPNASLGPTPNTKVVEVPTGADGKAAIELYLLEGNSGVSTVKATIIRPAGVDRGTKRLELHSATFTNHWSQESPLKAKLNAPPSIRWGERGDWSIDIENRSNVAKSGTLSIRLPAYVQLLSSTPQTTSVTQQPGGDKLVSWIMDFSAMSQKQIRFVLQAVTDNPSQELILELSPELTMYTSRETGSGNTTGSSSSTGGNSPSTYAPPNNPGSGNGGVDYGGIGTPGTSTQPPYDNPGGGVGITTLPEQLGNSDPRTFANQLTCVIQSAPTIPVDKTSEITVSVTNNSPVPFYKGRVLVEIPEGVEFRDKDGRSYGNTTTGAVDLIMDLAIIDAGGNEIPIRAGETFSWLLHIAPRKAVNINVKATVYGQTSTGEWSPIAGEHAQRIRPIGVLQ